ncbi:MAG: OmpA family protein [Bacteroidaceae bacterium]|nr:OmpA family protein [Bacteroidaceae bacterium]
MKKFMMSLVVASIAMVSYAQETVSEVVVPTVKNSVATNSFGSNWFVGVNGGVSFYQGVHTNGETPFDHMKPALSVYVGKWHTPGFGWRVKMEGLQVKPYDGVYFDGQTGFGVKDLYNFHFDAMFNLSNLIYGYREDRIWNFIPYVGTGYVTAKSPYSNKMSGSLAVNYGIWNTFRLNKHLAVNFEVSGTFMRSSFVSAPTLHNGYDNLWVAQVGLTYKFNKVGWEQTADVDAIMAMNGAALAELNAQLQAKEAENSQLKSQISSAKNALAQAQGRIKDMESNPQRVSVAQSVFFAINSSKIESKKEVLNLQALADAAKNSGAKLLVKGYADSATGSADYNQKLSEKRANAVADKLVELGVSRDQLDVKGMGGVETEKPARLNRRVIITLE